MVESSKEPQQAVEPQYSKDGEHEKNQKLIKLDPKDFLAQWAK